MLRISKQNEDIVIREIAFGEFVEIGGVAFVFLILFIFIGLTDMKGNFLFFLIALGFLAYIFYQLCLIQYTTLKINKNKRILTIQRKSLIKNKFSVFRFSEINDLVFVDTKQKENGVPVHNLIMPLGTGDKIDLTCPVSFGEIKYYETADLINNLIFNQPSKLPETLQSLINIKP